MNAELYRNELWEELKQAVCNLYYLDDLRARKKKIEPAYKGIVATVAIISACVSFVDCPVAIKLVTVVTALLTLVPLLFPLLLPGVAAFSEMDTMRVGLKKQIGELEAFWRMETPKESYGDYLKAKQAWAELETNLSALFGKVNARIEKYAIANSERYLERFTS
jgi:ABC-type transport system involved in cytochrome bd biosynthesis fused ATPase/permease subunit